LFFVINLIRGLCFFTQGFLHIPKGQQAFSCNCIVQRLQSGFYFIFTQKALRIIWKECRRVLFSFLSLGFIYKGNLPAILHLITASIYDIYSDFVVHSLTQTQSHGIKTFSKTEGKNVCYFLIEKQKLYEVANIYHPSQRY